MNGGQIFRKMDKKHRPVANVFEKVVARRQAHIKSNSMANSLVCLHRPFHSTESALLRMQNDITLNMYRSNRTDSHICRRGGGGWCSGAVRSLWHLGFFPAHS